MGFIAPPIGPVELYRQDQKRRDWDLRDQQSARGLAAYYRREGNEARAQYWAEQTQNELGQPGVSLRKDQSYPRP